MADLRLRLSRIEKNVDRLARNHVRWEQADREFFRFLSEDPEAYELARQLGERVADYSGPVPPPDHGPPELRQWVLEERRQWAWAVGHDDVALDLCGKLLSRWSEYGVALRRREEVAGAAETR